MLYVHGMGHFHPPTVIDNAFLEALDIGTSDEWILERVGIRERRTVLPLDYLRLTRNADPRAAIEAAEWSNAETGRLASLLALERAGIEPRDVGMVIAGGCSPEMSIPAEASRIAAALGIDAPAFDVSSACSSFGVQLHLLNGNDALPGFVLVVNPENNTRVVDYRDRSSAVLWGDGTSAAIVSTRIPSRLRVSATTVGSAPSGWAEVVIPRHGHFAQRGPAVQRFAIRTTLACLEELLPVARASAVRAGGRLRFIGHQANRLMLDNVVARAGIAPAEHWHHVERLGNTGAAGAPGVLSERWGELEDGDSIVVVVVGSGLTWSTMTLEVCG
ncbi:MAG TPA: 3-oxoacyl-[acyl-carrier-protein] synthase III C-terminal domain-containing protein [Vulgatibacter sp.]|nr:3-oxoacyl-[acyl-carrier-protein] synthase III C-terminal domain-containing protein [Vulgatibacter sp.]